MNYLEYMNSFGWGQFEEATWHRDGRDKPGIGIRVGIVTEHERRFDVLVQSIVTEKSSTVLETHFAYDYKQGQYFYYRRQWWQIVNVGQKDLDVNPTAMEFLGRNPNRAYYIELIGVK